MDQDRKISPSLKVDNSIVASITVRIIANHHAAVKLKIPSSSAEPGPMRLLHQSLLEITITCIHLQQIYESENTAYA